MNKLTLYFSTILMVCTFYSFKDTAQNEIIDKTISKLNSLENVQYDAEYNVKNESFGLDTTMVVKCYMENYPADLLAQMRFVIEAPDGLVDIYNGSSFFEKDVAKKRIVYNDRPNKRSIFASVLVVESYFGLRNILPALQNDSATSFIQRNDTIIDNKNCYNFEITTRGKYIRWSQQKLVSSEENKNGKYSICVDKKNYLPVYFSDLSDGSSSAITYKNVQTNKKEQDIKWNYLDYPDYVQFSTKEYSEIEEENGVLSLLDKYAPDFDLSTPDGESVKLSEQKGNLVLLTFLSLSFSYYF